MQLREQVCFSAKKCLYAPKRQCSLPEVTARCWLCRMRLSLSTYSVSHGNMMQLTYSSSFVASRRHPDHPYALVTE
eukprot:1921665-Pleurochrysis_carterae.AAC.1